MQMSKPGLIVISVLFSVGMVLPAVTQADDTVVCAQVFPCNSDGTVQAPFDEGECQSYYRSMCIGKAFNTVSADLVECENSHTDLEGENLVLDMRIHKLRTKLRQLRRQLRAKNRKG